MLYMGV